MFGFLGGLRWPSHAARRAEVTSGQAACWKDPHCAGSSRESMAELVPGHRGLQVLRWEAGCASGGSMVLAVQPEASRIYPDSVELWAGPSFAQAG